MSLLDSIYGAVVKAKNALHERGTLRTRRLQGPVVSVGNLAVGGSGKTPFVILLGELLKARGIEFDVLSRGYGRATSGVFLVVAGSLGVVSSTDDLRKVFMAPNFGLALRSPDAVNRLNGKFPRALADAELPMGRAFTVRSGITASPFRLRSSPLRLTSRGSRLRSRKSC